MKATASKNSFSAAAKSYSNLYTSKIALWRSTNALYLVGKSGEIISPTRNPWREILSVYVGPIPFKVEPIFASPFAFSYAASNKRWVGKMIDAFFEISKFLRKSKLK